MICIIVRFLISAILTLTVGTLSYGFNWYYFLSNNKQHLARDGH